MSDTFYDRNKKRDGSIKLLDLYWPQKKVPYSGFPWYWYPTFDGSALFLGTNENRIFLYKVINGNMMDTRDAGFVCIGEFADKHMSDEEKRIILKIHPSCFYYSRRS